MSSRSLPASRRGARWILATGLALCVAAVIAVLGGPAAATPPSPFYVPPASYSSEAGAIVRTEPMSVLIASPSGQWPLPAQRVMYTSRLQDDTPTAVTGTFIDAAGPWQGPGPRPTVVIAPGTVGQGDQCAASAAFPIGLNADLASLSISANQEALSAASWNALGARVFVTDYIGLGTPGIHTYTNRVEQAHAVLDGARAAAALTGGDTAAPLLLWGYSQGGGATAAAAELQPGYAPELNLKGTWAGAPTADLTEIIPHIDGTLIAAAIGFSFNGLLARHPELSGLLDARISPQGHALLGELENECIADVIFKHPFAWAADFTTDSRPIMDHIREVPEAAAILDAQRIGRLTPTSPVLITHGINDDTVPYGQGRRLADDWCALGATVTFRTNDLPPILPKATLPNHFGPEIIDAYIDQDNAFGYLLERLAGTPIDGCTSN
ncbi:lipase family protein [Nocardia wallacei]|uniref:lipase family protein n=1 Tax=Nocardia wallacei TaxID=480035 RepID=UPI002454C718|nr:lipase family protein [Nocardia wallacei]